MWVMRKHLRLNQIIRNNLWGTNARCDIHRRSCLYDGCTQPVRKMMKLELTNGILRWHEARHESIVKSRGGVGQHSEIWTERSSVGRNLLGRYGRRRRNKPHWSRWYSSGVLIQSDLIGSGWTSRRTGLKYVKSHCLMDFTTFISLMNKQEMTVVRNSAQQNPDILYIQYVGNIGSFVSYSCH